MKIGAKINLFNYKLRNKRIELGYTQKQMAEFLGCCQSTYGEVELLKMPGVARERLENFLMQISDILETPLDDLFPPEYFRFLERKSITVFYFMKDIDLDRLPSGATNLLSLPEMIEAVEAEETKTVIMAALDSLPPRERKVLELRNGFNGEPQTIEEVGRKMGVTCERVRLIEAQALSRLNHPTIRKELRN